MTLLVILRDCLKYGKGDIVEIADKTLARRLKRMGWAKVYRKQQDRPPMDKMIGSAMNKAPRR